jgi:hypothetical protein
MVDNREMLWPYGSTVAFVTLAVVVIVVAAVFAVARAQGIWPDAWGGATIFYIAVAIGGIPLMLALFDFFSSRRAIIDVKGFKIDFSNFDLTQVEIKAESFGLPDNIGIPGTIVTDSSPMQIVAALEETTNHEVALIDIKTGNAWWTTRLLALSAGAARAGSPKAFVFLGTKENVHETFLGWAAPSDIQEAILAAKREYRAVFDNATRIAKNVESYLPNAPGFIPTVHPDVLRYTSHQGYFQLGSAAFEQILMDQLAKKADPPAPGGLEDPPDRLTLGRLTELFGHCLYQDKIDLTWSKDKQILELLNSHSAYVVLLRGGRYESMLKREEGERVILKGVLSQVQRTKAS